MRLSGHNPSQEAKCASVFQRVISSPTSLIIVCATIALTPSILLRSTPVIRCNSLVRLKPGPFLWIRFVFLALGIFWWLRRYPLRYGKLLQRRFQFPVAFRDFVLIGV